MNSPLLAPLPDAWRGWRFRAGAQELSAGFPREWQDPTTSTVTATSLSGTLTTESSHPYYILKIMLADSKKKKSREVLKSEIEKR